MALRMAGLEIEADSCPSRIRRPYKTKGFIPKVLYFASSSLHLQPPPPIAKASCTRIVAAVKLASNHPSQSFNGAME